MGAPRRREPQSLKQNHREIQNKLKLVLKSPQGKEISKRSWHVSEKYRGGSLIQKKGSTLRRETEAEQEEKSWREYSKSERFDRRKLVSLEEAASRRNDLKKTKSARFSLFRSKSKPSNKESQSKSDRNLLSSSKQESRRELRRRQKEFEKYL